MKLEKKERIGGKMKSIYIKALSTPYNNASLICLKYYVIGDILKQNLTNIASSLTDWEGLTIFFSR